MSFKNVAVILISDAILENFEESVSCKYLVNELNSLSLSVRRITVIAEHENVIRHELQETLKCSDIIITVGGVNNGLINKALSKATSQEICWNEDLHKILTENNKCFTKSAVCLPAGTKILHSENAYPVLYMAQVFVLTEQYLEESFSKILKNYLVQYQKHKVYGKVLKIRRNGNHSRILTELEKYKTVSGSEIKLELSEDDNYTNIKISSSQFWLLKDFASQIQQKFKVDNFAFLDDENISDLVYSSNDLYIRNAIEDIEKALSQYGPENIFVCFNGGKDCTVLLHLVIGAMKKLYPTYKNQVVCLYIQSENQFPEQDEFIEECSYLYNLKIVSVQSEIKDALKDILTQHPHYKACFMGTRRTDPYCKKMNVFQMTDPHWPQIMRVSPLLDWKYSHIWDYLLYYKVPYCKLYDMGFTSLGNTVNTIKNPSLIYYDVYEDKESYLPAYKLLKESKERDGRNS